MLRFYEKLNPPKTQHSVRSCGMGDAVKGRVIVQLLEQVEQLKKENGQLLEAQQFRENRAEVRRPGRYIVDHAKGEHNLTIVLIPGYTGSAVLLMPWLKRLEEFGVDFSTVKVVGLTAPERATDLYNGWICNSWYDYLTDRVYEEEDINEKEVLQSRQILAEVVQEEVQLLGDAQKVLLVGFSQGTTMALDVALAFPEMLAGVIARRGHLLRCSMLTEAKKMMPTAMVRTMP